MILGQAISGARFGMAWAEGIVGQKMHTDETTGVTEPAFNPTLLSEMVYDQTVATLAITIVVGLVVGAALQRHLINGVGCFSATLFFAWLVLVVVFALPLLIYANVRSVFNQDKANEDCAAFPSSGYDFSKGACEARWWTFITGGIILFATLLVMTAFGLAEASNSILKVRNKALVKLKQLRGFHPAFREGPESRVSSVLGGVSTIENQRLLGGFQSADENFFNFKTSIDTRSTDQMLYAPRMQLTPAIARS